MTPIRRNIGNLIRATGVGIQMDVLAGGLDVVSFDILIARAEGIKMLATDMKLLRCMVKDNVQDVFTTRGGPINNLYERLSDSVDLIPNLHQLPNIPLLVKYGAYRSRHSPYIFWSNMTAIGFVSVGGVETPSRMIRIEINVPVQENQYPQAVSGLSCIVGLVGFRRLATR
ncbi:hypothetical protein KC326_g161 [Hortaea werneckii]|nr:hypothetical protein KC326_g161 [Hortaea werneckii]